VGAESVRLAAPEPVADNLAHTASLGLEAESGVERFLVIGEESDVLTGHGGHQTVYYFAADAQPAVRGRSPDVDQVGVANPVAEDASVCNYRSVEVAENRRVRALVRLPILLSRAAIIEVVRGEHGLKRRPIHVVEESGVEDLSHEATLSPFALRRSDVMPF